MALIVSFALVLGFTGNVFADSSSMEQIKK